MVHKNGKEELQFTLERFEGTKAILKYDGQELAIPRRSLPRDIQSGEVVRGEFITDRIVAKRREGLAKAILEEILQGE